MFSVLQVILYFINECECFTRVSKHARTMEFARLFTKQFLLFSRICETRKTMKTRGRNGRVVFIVLSVLQIQENNEYRLVNSRVNSIFLKCLETLVKHEPRVYEMTSQSKTVLRFEFIIKNCGNNKVFIVLTVFIIKKGCNGSPFIVSSVYYLIS